MCGNYGTTGQKTEKEKTKKTTPNLKSQGDISQAEKGLGGGGGKGGEFPLRWSFSEKQRGKSAQLLLEYASGSGEQETETVRRWGLRREAVGTAHVAPLGRSDALVQGHSERCLVQRLCRKRAHGHWDYTGPHSSIQGWS